MFHIKRKFKTILINLFIRKNQIKNSEYSNCDAILNNLKDFVEKNDELEYTIDFEEVSKDSKFSWVGAQIFNNKLYFIPNDENKVMVYDLYSNITRYIGNLGNYSFKWTGGNIYGNKLYCFPRSSNELLEINLETEQILLHDLKLNFDGEHHYGGVITDDGYIYQPPRNSNYILKINLKDYSTSKIYVASKFLKLRYCGSVVHPNGMIYFLPEFGKVLCLNPKNNNISFIGKSVNAYCFDAKVYYDGNIYGFSAYDTGILKIDVNKKTTTMLHDDTQFKSYGTKLGINGNLYNIPGDSDCFYEYNPIDDRINIIENTHEEGLKAKCAGGCVDGYGNIYSVPAHGRYMYMIKFKNKYEIPSELYNVFFKDNY